MKLIQYLEYKISDITENPNPDIVSFIKKRIPNINILLKQIGYLKNENILNVIIKPIINNVGDLVNKNISNNPKIDVNKRYYYRSINDIATRLPTKTSEHQDNVNGVDNNPTGENLQSLYEIFIYIYSIYGIFNNILTNNPDLSQEDIKFFKNSKEQILNIFQKSQMANKIFNNPNNFKNFPKIDKNFKIPKYINTIKKDNQKSKDNQDLLERTEFYYFDFNENKFKGFQDTNFDLPYKEKNLQENDLYTYVIKEYNKAGVYQLFQSPFTDNEIIKSKTIPLINNKNNKQDRTKLYNNLNKIYFIYDKSKGILINNSVIKNIEIIGEKPHFNFDTKKINFSEKKLGILQIT
jgi:hypothetical protein